MNRKTDSVPYLDSNSGGDALPCSDPPVVLLMPPLSLSTIRAWDHYPSLALLASYLKRHGIAVDMVDVNRGFICSLLENSALQVERDFTSQQLYRFRDSRSPSPDDLRSLAALTAYEAALRRLRLQNNKPLDKWLEASRLDHSSEFYLHFIRRYNLLADNTVALNNERILELLKGHATKEVEKHCRSVLQNTIQIRQGSFYGITVPSETHFVYALVLARLLQQLDPSGHVCLGGPFVSLKPADVLNFWVDRKYFHTYIRYAGERNLLALVRKWRSCRGDSMSSIPSYDFNADYYPRIDEQVLLPETVCSGFARVLISRNCYWNQCAFCDYVGADTGYQIKKIEVLTEEMKTLMKAKGITRFCLVTDALPPAYARRLARTLLNHQFNITWWATYLRIDKGYDTDLFLLMKKSGYDFTQSTAGVDSLSDNALKRMKKGYDSAAVVSFMKHAEEAAICFAQVNIILDLPGTTYDESLKGLRILRHYRHLFNQLEIFFFQLTSSSAAGRHPERYGLYALPHKARRYNQFYANSIAFTDPSGMCAEETQDLLKRYQQIRTEMAIAKAYPYFDVDLLGGVTFYDDDRYELWLKLPDVCEYLSFPFGPDGSKHAVPAKVPVPYGSYLPDSLLLMYQNYLQTLQPGRWYLLEEIVDQRAHTGLAERYLVLQKVFRLAKALMCHRYFADARLYLKTVPNRA